MKGTCREMGRGEGGKVSQAEELERATIVQDVIERGRIEARRLVCPLFIVRKRGVMRPIRSVPNVYRCSISHVGRRLSHIGTLRVPTVLVFKVPRRGSRIKDKTCSRRNVMRATVHQVGGSCPSLLIVTSMYLYRCASRKRYNLVESKVVLGSRALPLLTRATIDCTHTKTSVVTPDSVVSGHMKTVHRTLSTTKFACAPVVTCSTGFTSKCCKPFHSTTRSTPKFKSQGACRVSPTGKHRTVQRIRRSVTRKTSLVVTGPTVTCVSVVARVHEGCGVPVITCGIDKRCSVMGTTTTGK